MGGFADWEKYEWSIEYDDHEQGYRTSYTHEEYVRGFKVERKLVDDDQYNVINKYDHDYQYLYEHHIH